MEIQLIPGVHLPKQTPKRTSKFILLILRCVTNLPGVCGGRGNCKSGSFGSDILLLRFFAFHQKMPSKMSKIEQESGGFNALWSISWL